MSAKALVIHYPNGDYEYDLTLDALPAVGDTVRRKGEHWRVTYLVTRHVPTAYVERVDQKPPPPPHASG